MKRPSIVVFAFLVLVGVVGLPSAAQQPALSQTEVLRADLSIGGREVIQMLSVIPPGGASSGKHTHPGDEIVYVLEGSIRVEVDGEPPVVKNVGEAALLPAGRPHFAVNAGTGAARAVATYIVEKGKPRTTFIR
jgi:quercetin dioxygenase-like cupin family protein